MSIGKKRGVFVFALICGKYRPAAVDSRTQQTEGGLSLPSAKHVPPPNLNDRGKEPKLGVSTLMMAFRSSDSGDLLSFSFLLSSLGC